MDADVNRTLQEVKNDILDFFQAVVGNRAKDNILPIGKLTLEGKILLEKLSGLKMKERVDFVLDSSNLLHIYKNHYGYNEKDYGNNVPLSDSDIKNIVDVLMNPNGVLYGIDKKTGLKMFFFLSRNDVGTYNLAEVCSTKKGNLTARSYYHSKKGASQRVMEISRSLLPTSVTYSGATLSSGAKIPNLFETYNISDEKVISARDFRISDFSVQYNVPEKTVREYVLAICHGEELKAAHAVLDLRAYIEKQFPRLTDDGLDLLFNPIKEKLYDKFGSVSKGVLEAVDIEHHAKLALLDRIKGFGFRCLSSSQRDAVESFLNLNSDSHQKQLAKDRLFDDLSQSGEFLRIPSSWVKDAMDEVDDLIKGIIRNDSPSIHR